MNTYSFEIVRGTRSLIRIDANSLNEAIDLLAANTSEICSEEPFESEIELIKTLEY